MFKLNLGSFMYKHHTKQLPNIFSSYFTKHVQTHNYNTRNAQDYSINKTKKIFSDRAVRNCGPTFWNTLSNDIKRSKSIKEFRKKPKKTIYCQIIIDTELHISLYLIGAFVLFMLFVCLLLLLFV